MMVFYFKERKRVAFFFYIFSFPFPFFFFFATLLVAWRTCAYKKDGIITLEEILGTLDANKDGFVRNVRGWKLKD